VTEEEDYELNSSEGDIGKSVSENIVEYYSNRRENQE
jgi:hypothetical protein